MRVLIMNKPLHLQSFLLTFEEFLRLRAEHTEPVLADLCILILLIKKFYQS